jgi:hypothetical protein
MTTRRAALPCGGAQGGAASASLFRKPFLPTGVPRA